MQKAISVLKLALIAMIAVGLPLLLIWRQPEFVDQFRTIDGVNAFLDRYETIGMFVYIGMQIIQTVITFIPGQVVQMAGGYVYGVLLGFTLSIVGIAIGTIIAFYISRLLGRKAIYVLFGEEKINRFVTKLNSKRGFAIIFVLYLVPGVPKDLIVYAAGISEMRLQTLLILSLSGRTPAMLISLLIGVMLQQGRYSIMIVLAVVVILLAIIGYWKRDQLTHLTDRIYQKLNK